MIARRSMFKCGISPNHRHARPETLDNQNSPRSRMNPKSLCPFFHSLLSGTHYTTPRSTTRATLELLNVNDDC